MRAKDLKDKKFKQRVSGYDKKEVNAFLNEVMRTMDTLEANNQYMQQELYSVNNQLDTFRGKEATLNRSIVVAQQAADHLREQALTEAEEIINNATKEANRILEESAKKASSIELETEQLKGVSRQYLHQMLGFVNQIKDTLEDDRWEYLYGAQAVQSVDTPILDEVIKALDLPVFHQKGEEIFDANAEEATKKKQQEEFFSQGDGEAKAQMPEEAQAIFEAQKQKMTEQKQQEDKE